VCLQSASVRGSCLFRQFDFTTDKLSSIRIVPSPSTTGCRLFLSGRKGSKWFKKPTWSEELNQSPASGCNALQFTWTLHTARLNCLTPVPCPMSALKTGSVCKAVKAETSWASPTGSSYPCGHTAHCCSLLSIHRAPSRATTSLGTFRDCSNFNAKL
jgi:hypothetical protein